MMTSDPLSGSRFRSPCGSIQLSSSGQILASAEALAFERLRLQIYDEYRPSSYIAEIHADMLAGTQWLIRDAVSAIQSLPDADSSPNFEHLLDLCDILKLLDKARRDDIRALKPARRGKS